MQIGAVALQDFVGVLKGVRGRTVDTQYDLFFADRRMVAALLVHPSDFDDIYGKLDLTTIILGNLPKQISVKTRTLKLIESRRSSFENKTLDEILTLHRLNFEIDYENIVSVTVKKGFMMRSLEFTLHNPPRKINFSLEEDQIAEARDLINRVLPGKVK